MLGSSSDVADGRVQFGLMALWRCPPLFGEWLKLICADDVVVESFRGLVTDDFPRFDRVATFSFVFLLQGILHQNETSEQPKLSLLVPFFGRFLLNSRKS